MRALRGFYESYPRYESLLNPDFVLYRRCAVARTHRAAVRARACCVYMHYASRMSRGARPGATDDLGPRACCRRVEARDER